VKTKGVVKARRLRPAAGRGGAGGASVLGAPSSSATESRRWRPTCTSFGSTLLRARDGEAFRTKPRAPMRSREQLTSDDPHPARVHHSRPEISPRFEAPHRRSAREGSEEALGPVEKSSKRSRSSTRRKASRSTMPPRGRHRGRADRAPVQTDFALKDFYPRGGGPRPREGFSRRGAGHARRGRAAAASTRSRRSWSRTGRRVEQVARACRRSNIAPVGSPDGRALHALRQPTSRS